MNYTLNQLYIFQKVVNTKSITKAAEELHLTQPAVSIQLKNFQQQFDIPLTEVVNKRLYITDFGKEIAIAVDSILNEVSNINSKTHAFKGQLSGILKISVVSTGKYIIPYFLSEFLKENKNVQLQLDVTNKTKVLESLEKNEVDFCLVSILPEKISVNKIDLIQNKLFLVANNTFKASSKAIEKSVFNEIDLIYRESGSGTRKTMEQYFEKKKINIKNKLELTSNEAVKQAVIAGLGYSIMPLIGIKNELELGQLKIVPVKGLPIKTMWNLIWHKNKNLSPVAAAYLDYLKKEKKNIIHQVFDWYEKY
jgi:LysR family transcriptional regulator, low CO2-responsive transcriptional regulator